MFLDRFDIQITQVQYSRVAGKMHGEHLRWVRADPRSRTVSHVSLEHSIAAGKTSDMLTGAVRTPRRFARPRGRQARHLDVQGLTRTAGRTSTCNGVTSKCADTSMKSKMVFRCATLVRGPSKNWTT